MQTIDRLIQTAGWPTALFFLTACGGDGGCGDRNATTLLVVAGVGTLFAVDLGTGDRSIVSSPTIGNGIKMGGIYSLALDGTRNSVVVVDYIFASLSVIELSSGDRVVISK